MDEKTQLANAGHSKIITHKMWLQNGYKIMCCIQIQLDHTHTHTFTFNTVLGILGVCSEGCLLLRSWPSEEKSKC